MRVKANTATGFSTLALPKDLPVISVFLSEYFGSVYFIKSDLSVLGEVLYVHY